MASLNFGAFSALLLLLNKLKMGSKPSKGSKSASKEKKVVEKKAANKNQKGFEVTPANNFPDLSKHNNHMAKCLTKEIYGQLYDKTTAKGYTLDMAIQTGVDNPGHPFILTVGLTAGDEESYKLFAPLFNPVIESRHPGFKFGRDKQKTDLDASHLKAGQNFPLKI